MTPLISPQLPDKANYCLLEIYKIQDPSVIKALMIIDMSKPRKLTIGRNEGNDIRFKHHSISRDHCLLSLDKKFRLIDYDSKYGSFIELKKLELTKRENMIF